MCQFYLIPLITMTYISLTYYYGIILFPANIAIVADAFVNQYSHIMNIDSGKVSDNPAFLI